MVFDYVFVEGALAFFRTGLVLLKMLKNDIDESRDVLEFNMAFEVKTRSITDIERFRDRMRSIYMNADLLNICRAKNIDHKQNKFYESSNQRVKGFERCLESSPYCHWERNAKFKEFTDHTIRAYCLSDCLKFNFFDPFKNSGDTQGYDYLKHGEDKHFVNEDRFSTYTSKKPTKMGLRKDSRGQIATETQDIEEEAILHRTYLEKMISGQIRAPASSEGQGSGSAGNTRLGDPKAPRILSEANLHTPDIPSGGSTARKLSETSEAMVLKKLGSQLVQPPKLYFENQDSKCPDEPITLARQKQIEKNLVIARCPHICSFEKYEYIHREINQKDKNKYFLIVNSILYKYLGPQIKNLHAQTEKVISDEPRLAASSIQIDRTMRGPRRQCARQSLDRWPRTIQRFLSVETGRRLVNNRANFKKFLPDFSEQNRPLDVNFDPIRVQDKSMPNLGNVEDKPSEIGLEEMRVKYKHAYNLDEEGFKRDMLRMSKGRRESPELAREKLSL